MSKVEAIGRRHHEVRIQWQHKSSTSTTATTPEAIAQALAACDVFDKGGSLLACDAGVRHKLPISWDIILSPASYTSSSLLGPCPSNPSQLASRSKFYCYPQVSGDEDLHCE